LIPEFEDNGLLPPGIHWSTIDEVKSRLCFSQRRIELVEGLERALASLKSSGCETVYIDGSFSTNKTNPGDIDVCWDTKNVDVYNLLKIEPVFFDLSRGRAAQKAKFGCEFFAANSIAKTPNTCFLDFFQEDRNGMPKGIIGLKI
jgi:hypothetical protein